jgi:hypothetical protein
MINALNVIIPIFNQLIESPSSYLFPKGPNYYCLENILTSFLRLTFSGTFSTQFIDEIIKKDVFLKIISLFEKHVEKLKSRELGICSSILESSMGLIFNISIEGSLGGNVNIRSSLFNNKTEEILISMYNFLRTILLFINIYVLKYIQRNKLKQCFLFFQIFIPFSSFISSLLRQNKNFLIKVKK